MEIISRDRGGPSAEGARQGAPDAQHIADRWSLLAKLSEALKPLFVRKQAQLKALVHKPSETFSDGEAKQLPPWYKGCTNSKQASNDARRQERVERYHKAHELHAQNAEITLIAHQTGLSRQSVYTYLKMEQPPERKRGKSGTSGISPYKECLIAGWNEGGAQCTTRVP